MCAVACKIQAGTESSPFAGLSLQRSTAGLSPPYGKARFTQDARASSYRVCKPGCSDPKTTKMSAVRLRPPAPHYPTALCVLDGLLVHDPDLELPIRSSSRVLRTDDTAREGALVVFLRVARRGVWGSKRIWGI